MIKKSVVRSFMTLLFICTCWIIFYVFMSSHNLHPPNSMKVFFGFPYIKIENTIRGLSNGARKSPSMVYSEEIQKLYPNISFHFLHNKMNSRLCGSPQFKSETVYNDNNNMNLFGIELSDEHWQKYRSKMNTLYLYNAYLDNRTNNVDGPSIRIITMALGVLDSNATYYCLTWLNASAAPIVSDAPLKMDAMIQMINITYDLKNKYVPYLLTCKVPHYNGDQNVQAVSIVEDNGNKSSCYKPSNYLKVIYNNEQIKDFAVC